MTLPLVLSVGAGVHAYRGRGTLTILPGEIVLEPGTITGKFAKVQRIVHRKPTVTVIIARLLPGRGVTVVLEDGEETAVASMPRRLQRPVEAALSEAGFGIEHVVTKFSTGNERVRPWVM